MLRIARKPMTTKHVTRSLLKQKLIKMIANYIMIAWIKSKEYEFIDVPSFVAFRSFDAFALVYSMRVEGKWLAGEDITICERKYKKGEYYVKGQYLAIGIRSTGGGMAFPAEKIFEPFFDID